MFLSLGSFELFSQEGGKKGLRNHFGFFWSLSASWRQCGSPCAGIQVLCGCCRSQFHVLPDKARCGFSRGAGMSSESLLSCSAVKLALTFPSLQTIPAYSGSLSHSWNSSCPQPCFLLWKVLHVSARSEAPPDTLGYANSSLWGMVHCEDLTCAPVPALLISKYMDWGSEYPFNFLPMEHNETSLWLKNADNLWDGDEFQILILIQSLWPDSSLCRRNG